MKSVKLAWIATKLYITSLNSPSSGFHSDTIYDHFQVTVLLKKITPATGTLTAGVKGSVVSCSGARGNATIK